jgi:hypothetical protein
LFVCWIFPFFFLSSTLCIHIQSEFHVPEQSNHFQQGWGMPD